MSKPLFIPLRREHFEAFTSGEKDTEYRPYGPRWNQNTCWLGRPVVLSCGYGKRKRRAGKVVGFKVCQSAATRTEYVAIYGHNRKPAACIKIKLNEGG